MATNESDFGRLLSACSELAELFPEGLVFIGGIAVYVHAKNHVQTAALAETTHDADLYISMAYKADLRDIEEVSPNRRLSKSQLIKDGFEFDIYTERQSSLIVPYDMVSAYSVQFDTLRVAGLEHLFVLKLEAFRDRQNSAKGAKDARDLLRICAVIRRGKTRWNPALVAPYLNDEHLALFARLRKSPEAIALAEGNAVAAKRLRADQDAVLTSIETLPAQGR